MLPRIFIDSSAFLALEDESDQYHEAALQFREQVLRKKRYDDKDFSFTDCVSFVVMWETGIKEAFAFDEHFNQMGFIRKP